MAGINYVPNNPLDIKRETFNTMRYYFRQFGLGVPTGIDLPNESIGQMGRTDNIPGFYLIMQLTVRYIYAASTRSIYVNHCKRRLSNETANCTRSERANHIDQRMLEKLYGLLNQLF